MCFILTINIIKSSQGRLHPPEVVFVQVTVLHLPVLAQLVVALCCQLGLPILPCVLVLDDVFYRNLVVLPYLFCFVFALPPRVSPASSTLILINEVSRPASSDCELLPQSLIDLLSAVVLLMSLDDSFFMEI